MQYFTALKIGEKRVKTAQEILNKYTGNVAMPALALKDNNNNNWEPVGEENYFTTVKNENGYLIAICDKNGIAKSVAQWFIEVRKDEIIKNIIQNEKILEYYGKVILPI
ncbi:MAG TPA: hypothetical protein VHH33_04555 [Nitrososphaeraceae archaeon]|jgi:hypothetical protein|nr:hypothetical protein [Nitrososphaeraceae archaeon]